MENHIFTDRIHRAPNDKFYALRQGQAVCIPNGTLRYFDTENEAWAFLVQSDLADMHQIDRCEPLRLGIQR
jgi:hypothetical protein